MAIPGNRISVTVHAPAGGAPSSLINWLNTERAAGRINWYSVRLPGDSNYGTYIGDGNRLTTPHVSFNYLASELSPGYWSVSNMANVQSLDPNYLMGILDGITAPPTPGGASSIPDGVLIPGPSSSGSGGGQSGANLAQQGSAAFNLAVTPGGSGNDLFNNQGISLCSRWIPAKYYYIAAAVAGGVAYSSEKRTAQVGFGVLAAALVLLGSKCQQQQANDN